MNFRIYIDKEFIRALQNVDLLENEVFQDLFNFLSNLIGLDIVLNYADRSELEVDMKSENVIALEAVLNYSSVSLEAKFLNQAFNAEIYKHFGPFAFFFTEDKRFNTKCREWGYEAISSDELNNRWKIYSRMSESFDFQLPANQTDVDELDEATILQSWGDAEVFHKPAHAVIFVDRYQFSNRPNLYFDKNFAQIFKFLSSDHGRTKIQCCHITHDKKPYDSSSKGEEKPELTLSNEDKLALQHDVERIPKTKRVETGIIFLNSGQKNATFPDRFIYTNNFKMIPSHGTTVLKNDGFSYAPGMTFRHKFIFRHPTLKTVKRELQRLSDVIVPMKEKSLKGTLNYTGKKENRLLNM